MQVAATLGIHTSLSWCSTATGKVEQLHQITPTPDSSKSQGSQPPLTVDVQKNLPKMDMNSQTLLFWVEYLKRPLSIIHPRITCFLVVKFLTSSSWWLNHPFQKYAQVKLDSISPRDRGESKIFETTTTWMSREVSKWLGSVGYNPNISHL